MSTPSTSKAGPGTPRTPRRASLDQVDRLLIDLLADDGRMSNRALATIAGLSETTIASRIQALLDQKVLSFTALIDWRAAGYAVDMWLEVTVEPGRANNVGADIAGLDRVLGLYETIGFVDLVVHVATRDLEDALTLIGVELAAIPGISDIRVNLSLKSLKYYNRYALLPAVPSEFSVPAPCISLDDLDLKIIAALVNDGRQSNRMIGRGLNVAESTVRARLRRLESSGLVKIVAQSDPFRTGLATMVALVGILVDPQHRLTVAEQLVARPETTSVALTTGGFDILTFVSASSRDELATFVVDVIRAMPGVRSTLTAEVTRALLQHHHFSLLI